MKQGAAEPLLSWQSSGNVGDGPCPANIPRGMSRHEKRELLVGAPFLLEPPAEAGDTLILRVREDLLHLEREAHVALDLELAAHERHLRVELARDHVEVVARRHRD